MRFATILTSAIAALGITTLAAPTGSNALSNKDVSSPGIARDALIDSRSLVVRAESEALKEAINEIDHPPSDYYNRGDYVKRIVTSLRDRFPGHNVFIYHRFQGDFRWGVTDPSALEAEESFFAPDSRTEYFWVVLFRSEGVLEKVEGDGGWPNWGWSGWWDRDGDKVTFRHPA